MTPKEKALELYNKFNPHVEERNFFGDNVEHINTKECVLIAVDEIYSNCTDSSKNDYWIEVKNELDNL
jgi:hypothetical protein